MSDNIFTPTILFPSFAKTKWHHSKESDNRQFNLALIATSFFYLRYIPTSQMVMFSSLVWLPRLNLLLQHLFLMGFLKLVVQLQPTSLSLSLLFLWNSNFKSLISSRNKMFFFFWLKAPNDEKNKIRLILFIKIQTHFRFLHFTYITVHFQFAFQSHISEYSFQKSNSNLKSKRGP